MLPSKGKKKPPSAHGTRKTPAPRPHGPSERVRAYREGRSHGDRSRGSPERRTGLPRLSPSPSTPAASRRHNPVPARASAVRTAEERRAAAARHEAQRRERRRSLQRPDPPPPRKATRAVDPRAEPPPRDPDGRNRLAAAAAKSLRFLPPLSYARGDSQPQRSKTLPPLSPPRRFRTRLSEADSRKRVPQERRGAGQRGKSPGLPQLPGRLRTSLRCRAMPAGTTTAVLQRFPQRKREEEEEEEGWLSQEGCICQSAGLARRKERQKRNETQDKTTYLAFTVKEGKQIQT